MEFTLTEEELRNTISNLEKRINKLEKRVEKIEREHKELYEILREFVMTLRDIFKVVSVIPDIVRIIKELVTVVKELRSRVEGLERRLEAVERRLDNVEKRLDNVEKRLTRLEGNFGELRGMLVERNIFDRLRVWFARHDPDFEVDPWFATGADVIIRGKNICAVVEITITPTKKDVDQVVVGKGVVLNEYGIVPNVLIIYSASGVIPKEVVEYARRKNVYIVKSPREIREIIKKVS